MSTLTRREVLAAASGRVRYLAAGHHRPMLELPWMQQLMANAALWCISAVRWG